jgi:membrane-bound lytic murein transglycosylase D
MSVRFSMKQGSSGPWGAAVAAGLVWALFLPAPARPETLAAALSGPSLGSPTSSEGDIVITLGPRLEPNLGANPASAGESLPGPTVVSPYPIIINDMVESFIELFSSERKRDIIARWLSRSGKYLGMIKGVFREKGLPEELAYTAMIESGFNPLAVSRAGAQGLWQFMEATARRYGLTVNPWVDERLDPAKSTIAAAHYLKDLFDIFGHWFLAQAAYNAGELKVARAISLAKSSDFWGLTRTRYLKDETKQFVPQIVAATLIAQDPARFGFDVEYQEPEPFDLVTVSRPTELRRVAKLAGTTVERLRELNPALKLAVTPLDPPQYTLRVPHETGDAVFAGLVQRSDDDPVRWVVHRAGPGQRVEDVARIYGTPAARIAEVNLLTRPTFRAATELLVPIMPRRPRERGSAEETHVVHQGDTLGAIAKSHGVTVEEIARWNRLANPDRLQVGEVLRLRPPRESRAAGVATPNGE